MNIVHRCFEYELLYEQFSALANTLLCRNDALSGHLNWIEGPTEEPSDGQLTLAAIALLDLEVPNSGLLQFFWNCPGWVDEAPLSLRTLGFQSLADVLEHSIEDLVSDFGTYTVFRKRNTLEAYSECAAVYSFAEFDSAYYSQSEQIHTAAIAFVRGRMADFVV